MVFAYEPEAAALFTQYDFLHSEECFIEFCYLVVDCGGGTVDIAAHKITKQHGRILINDIAPPHGSNCGGFAVNDQFEKLLIAILKISPEKFQQLKIDYAVLWNTLMNENFEKNKITLDPEDELSSITLEVPAKIYKEVEKVAGKPFEKLIDDYGDEDIEWDEDEVAIILNYSVIDKLFEPVLDKICELIKTVLAKTECNEVKTILLVGGFAESANLFKRIKDTFGKDYNVNRSTTPAFSVVKGAVLCGQQEKLKKPLLENINNQPNSPPQKDEATDIEPTLDSTLLASQHSASVSESSTEQTKEYPSAQPVESPMQIVKYLPPAITKHLPFVLSRKMKHTVGVETVEKFQYGNHDISKLQVYNKKKYCKNVFCTLVKANESVQAGSPKRMYKFVPANEKQSTCIVNIFASNKENVKYIDDEGCKLRGKVEISIPEHNTSLSREVEVRVNFYNTEVEIEVYSVINNEVKKIPVDYEFFHTQS